MRKLLLLSLCVMLIGAGCSAMNYPDPTRRPTLTPRVAPTDVPTEAPPVEPPGQPTQAASVVLVSSSGTLPGDPASGDVLFHTFQPGAGISCTGCHRVDSDDRLIGPGLKSVGIRAQTRVPGLSAQEYIRTSIIHPSAFVVEGYPDLMPKNWGMVFSEQQVNDLVAYLMSLSQS